MLQKNKRSSREMRILESDYPHDDSRTFQSKTQNSRESLLYVKNLGAPKIFLPENAPEEPKFTPKIKQKTTRYRNFIVK